MFNVARSIFVFSVVIFSHLFAEADGWNTSVDLQEKSAEIGISDIRTSMDDEVVRIWKFELWGGSCQSVIDIRKNGETSFVLLAYRKDLGLYPGVKRSLSVDEWKLFMFLGVNGVVPDLKNKRAQDGVEYRVEHWRGAEYSVGIYENPDSMLSVDAQLLCRGISLIDEKIEGQ